MEDLTKKPLDRHGQCSGHEDRHHAVDPPDVGGLLDDRAGEHARGHEGGGQGAAAAVSYTHLTLPTKA